VASHGANGCLKRFGASGLRGELQRGQYTGPHWLFVDDGDLGCGLPGPGEISLLCPRERWSFDDFSGGDLAFSQLSVPHHAHYYFGVNAWIHGGEAVPEVHALYYTQEMLGEQLRVVAGLGDNKEEVRIQCQ